MLYTQRPLLVGLEGPQEVPVVKSRLAICKASPLPVHSRTVSLSHTYLNKPSISVTFEIKLDQPSLVCAVVSLLMENSQHGAWVPWNPHLFPKQSMCFIPIRALWPCVSLLMPELLLDFPTQLSHLHTTESTKLVFTTSISLQVRKSLT